MTSNRSKLPARFTASAPWVLLGLMLVTFLSVGLGLFGDLFPEEMTWTWRAPSSENLLGTGPDGSDLIFYVSKAALNSLGAALLGAIVAIVLGVGLGVGRGYFSGIVSKISWYVSCGFGVLPTVFVVLIYIGFRANFRLWEVMVIFGVLQSPHVGDLVRLRILELKRTEFISAAKALGFRTAVIIVKHILVRGSGSLLAMALCHSIRDALILDYSIGVLGMDVDHVPSLGQFMRFLIFLRPGCLDLSFTNVHWISLFSVTLLLLVSLTAVGNSLGRRAQFGRGGGR